MKNLQMILDFAISIFSFKAELFVVFGIVFGISIKEVTPPATAALDSEKNISFMS